MLVPITCSCYETIAGPSIGIAEKMFWTLNLTAHYKEYVIYRITHGCYYHPVEEQASPRSLRMRSLSTPMEETQVPDRLTETIVDKLNNPSTSSDFDFHEGVNQVLADIGMSAADSGGQLTFYGQDPIVPSRIRFATMAGIGLAAKTIAAAAVWRDRTGQGQNGPVGVLKAVRRFARFFEWIWGSVTGRAPAMGFLHDNTFVEFPLF